MGDPRRTSVPPPGFESPAGGWGVSRPDAEPPDDQSPLDPLSRRLLQVAAGLGVLLIGLVAFADFHGSSQTSLNPIADAAERTEGLIGARMTFSVTYTGAAIPGGFVMHGEGVMNGRSERSRAEAALTVEGRRLGMEAVSDRHTIYMRGSMFDSELPPGKEWLAVEPLLGHNPDSTFACGCDLRRQLEMLKEAGGEVEKVGEQSVRGVPTTRYRGAIEIDRIVSMLREEGKPDLAAVFERTTKGHAKEIPVEVWVDEEGLLHRMREIQVISAGPGKPQLRMDLQMTLYDFSITPNIQLPPPGKVFDATPLVQAELGLFGRRAKGPSTAKAGAALPRPAFRAQVGKVCGAMKRDFRSLKKKGDGLSRRAGRLTKWEGLKSPATRRALRRLALVVFEPLVETAEEAYGRLERIAPPPGLAKDYRRYLRLSAKQIDLVRALTRAFETGEYKLIDRLEEQGEKLSGGGERLAKKVGASRCEETD
ncbi:MAG TPA: hypothetical protein VFZ41_09505 [Solirubrobacterales bacterium]